MSTGLDNCRLHVVDYFRHCSRYSVVFPDSYDLPPSTLENSPLGGIPCDVPSHFLGPPFCIRCRRFVMLRTVVPKATVDENAYSLARERNVCPAAHRFDWS